ncbi:restriction endonuclease subunit S [Neptuniibacter marinus]|uniref:restriction endonuclease subunit S n=1 Tax=Neptuniibacter marinus TaxID=1806670 RepID=UPI003B5C4713
MGSEWKEVKLSDVCEIRRGSSPRPIVNYITKTTGMPWVKIADATECNSRLINKTNQYIKEEGVCRSVIVHKGDLILSNSGTAGLPKFMGITACIHDGWQVLKKLNGITKEYLYYTLIYLRPHLLHNANDSTMKNLTLDMVRDAKIRLPSLHRQEKIAQILSSIDKKIQLNRQTNQTLEQMAQALFKSWFVDFDPVIDNALAAGKPIPEELQARAQRRQQQLAKPDHQPLPDDVRQLFPSEFEETEELGWIPKGWERVLSGNIVDVRDGTHDSPKKSEEGFPLVTSRHITSGTLKLEDTYLISKEDYDAVNKRSEVSTGDILLTMIGTVGIPYLVLEQPALFAIKNVGLFRTSVAPSFKNYLYQLLLSPNMKNYLEARMAGTTQKYLSLKALRNLEMVLPKPQILDEYNNISNVLNLKIKSNLESIATLEKLRDTLLPKLISGELRLPESLLDSETNPSETAYE